MFYSFRVFGVFFFVISVFVVCIQFRINQLANSSLFTVVLVCLKTVLKNLLLKKFSRVVVVYCSVIKVLFCCSFQAAAFIFYQKPFSLSRTFLTFFKAIWLLFSNKLIYIIISFFICQDFFQFFFFAVSHESALTVYHFRFHLSRTFSSFFGISALFSNWWKSLF